MHTSVSAICEAEVVSYLYYWWIAVSIVGLEFDFAVFFLFPKDQMHISEQIRNTPYSKKIEG